MQLDFFLKSHKTLKNEGGTELCTTCCSVSIELCRCGTNCRTTDKILIHSCTRVCTGETRNAEKDFIVIPQSGDFFMHTDVEMSMILKWRPEILGEDPMLYYV